MTKAKLFFLLLISISIIGTSCKKDSDDPTTPDPSGNFKGSFDINLNGTTYNKLKSDIVEMSEGVTFLVDNKKGGQFQFVIPNIPAVGETVTLDLNAPEDATMIMLALTPIEGYATLIAGAGTITRQSADKYVFDATLYAPVANGDQFPLTGSVTVGKHGR